MIRIDEIYYNVFASALQDHPNDRVHWFDPFGSVKFEDLRSFPVVTKPGDRHFVFWDQEPIYQWSAAEFFDQYRSLYKEPTTLITSERDSEQVRIVCDTYNLKSAYYFFHGWAALDWYRGYDRTFLCRPWKDRYIFTRLFCPNNIVSGERSHRLKLLSALDTRNIIKDNLISFPSVCPFAQLDVHDLLVSLDLPPLKHCTLPLTIDRNANHANDSHRIDFWQQASNSFCHIVTETIYTGVRSHLTEKTFKPIVLQQPFILVAPRHSLRYLRSYGFKTFSSIWDESYDDLDDDDRINAIADLCKHIDSWTISDVKDRQKAITDIVEHNFNWFYHGFEGVLWDELTSMIESWS